MVCPHVPRAALGRATPRARERFGVRRARRRFTRSSCRVLRHQEEHVLRALPATGEAEGSIAPDEPAIPQWFEDRIQPVALREHGLNDHRRPEALDRLQSAADGPDFMAFNVHLYEVET